ncbi:MAG: chorismate mutase [Acidobacteriota bacterium]|jgi:chorismate mutase|nr:chorismate mutase [Acidobacteriota bacterium]
MTKEEARQKLTEYRVFIDELDRRIVALLNERTRVVEDIGRVKRDAEMPVYEPEREQRVFDNVRSVSNDDPLAQQAVRRIFERIIEEMRMIQRLRMESNGDQPAGKT